ncbi:MAG: DNA mismatch repair endonuclease MutL [Bacteroidales bacterium]|jgi:DNA mismatch repair protein MutL|nr:DNA mismatch repair endonuclease MutL [Bacteroidales bacterium]MCB9028331.1 DNA mismatch repair endonuclease MutL [Bacteroidales bacterium]MDD3736724.1 DNA mismatch repair endonuclease MutL [Bacteroidales bacterium]NLD64239.1 DNA mismatch repair endonuclease MutL [Bacteroidales bacterium]HOO67611.1 DNA mismatch repair endonuclease MutL [Bacteroidales bacterium]
MSDLIKLLPDSVANQIAAGEVIQRPSSVVKELTENAVDAGATEISIVIRDAGRTLVQVIDNGSGMSETDARLSFERHATSKISSADDLFTITTKGFRGEALASIAAVSMTELRTRREEDEAGTLVEINNSRVTRQEPCSCPAGSVFSVRNLFYNVPARRKFLKTDTTEFRHIITEFQRVALAHPEIRFNLTHNDQEIYRLSPGNHRQRIVGLFGKQYNQNLVSVETSTSIVAVRGYAGKPENARRSAGEQFFFVNNRFIRHPYLHRAVMEAYQGLLPPDTVPAYFIFMTADPASVDVNIHPTKTEIKFEDERSVWQIMLASVREALGRFNVVPSLDFGPEGAVEIPVITGNTPAPTPPHIDVDQSFNPFDGTEYNRPETKWKWDAGRSTPSDWESLFTITTRSKNRSESESQSESDESMTPGPADDVQGAGQRRFFQVKNRYIMCPVISGIMMIDQRRAHERVLYERYLASLGDGPRPAQVSLFPIETELNPGEMAILEEIGEQLRLLGFGINCGSENKVTITGHPADSRNANPLAMLETIISEYRHTMGDPSIGARERVALSMARASAIQYGTPLTHTEMEELFDMLFACSLPNYSPTGKTVMNIITLEELDRRFS